MKKTIIVMLLGLISATAFAVDVGYNCIPVSTGQIASRVHVQCSQPVLDGSASIQYFALPTTGNGDEAKTANRFLAVAMTALSSGKPIVMMFSSGDTSGDAYGCWNGDCRKPSAFFLLK